MPLDDPALAPARARLDAHVGGARRRDGALAMLAKASAARCARAAHISNALTDTAFELTLKTSFSA